MGTLLSATPSKHLPPPHCSIGTITYWQTIQFQSCNSLYTCNVPYVAAVSGHLLRLFTVLLYHYSLTSDLKHLISNAHSHAMPTVVFVLKIIYVLTL